MLDHFLDPQTQTDAWIDIWILTTDEYPNWWQQQPPHAQRWIEQHGFKGEAGQFIEIPGEQGEIAAVAFGLSETFDRWNLAGLRGHLAQGFYRIQLLPTIENWSAQQWQLSLLGWALAGYEFQHYKPKKNPKTVARLQWPGCLNYPGDWMDLEPLIDAIKLLRDLINLSAEDLGPAELADIIRREGERHEADVTEIIGDDLLKAGYQGIHAVGRASSREPRLVQLIWGNPEHPKLVLVGKGVCFDSGGLNLKPGQGLRWMKKDMGGAAHALALAILIMRYKVPVFLQLLIPAVENVIGGRAYKPGDILTMYNGTTVEIVDTDAEGRLILSEALATGAESEPQLMIDFATLTGAARVALGPDVPAFFTEYGHLADCLQQSAQENQDALWRLPLYAPYKHYLESRFADLVNAGSAGYAGAITAALFLQHFVPKHIAWLHIDVMAWNEQALPGRPFGGEAMSLLATFHALRAFLDV